MRTALIGYTGFVGGHLHRQLEFSDVFNSSNIQAIQGQEFERVYCAGAPGRKWWANQHPDEDAQSIDTLITNLKQIKTKSFILISSVDVYPQPLAVDEETPIQIQDLSPYGKNRLRLEQFVIEQFSDAVVVRLPGLFGHGLKKNIIFDFLHNNQLENINAQSSFQFYNLEHLSEDIQTALDCELSLVNLATEPTTVQEVAKECFDQYFQNTSAPQAKYDVHTCFAECFGATGLYIRNKAQVLTELKAFVQKETLT